MSHPTADKQRQADLAAATKIAARNTFSQLRAQCRSQEIALSTPGRGTLGHLDLALRLVWAAQAAVAGEKRWWK